MRITAMTDVEVQERHIVHDGGEFSPVNVSDMGHGCRTIALLVDVEHVLIPYQLGDIISCAIARRDCIPENISLVVIVVLARCLVFHMPRIFRRINPRHHRLLNVVPRIPSSVK
jgi:hypothetical protein